MKITVLVTLLFMIVFSSALTTSAFAKSEIEISGNSNFSSQTKEFSAGQTIYVRIKFETYYPQVNLTLDDNNSNPLKTVEMSKLDDHTYTGSLTAPDKSNYYLIRIEASDGDSKKSTIVRTVKVGETNSASLNVNIDNSTSGEGNKPSKNNTTANSTTNTNTEENEDLDDKVSIIRQVTTPEVGENKEKIEDNKLLKMILFVTNPILFVTFLLLS